MLRTRTLLAAATMVAAASAATVADPAPADPAPAPPAQTAPAPAAPAQTAPAPADPDQGLIDPERKLDCTRPHFAQRLINRCSALMLRALDEKMAALYQQILAAISDERRREHLKASQDTWLAWRGAQCALEAPPERRGSLVSYLYTSCARAMTEARIAQLEHFRDCHVQFDESKCRR